MKPDHTYFMPYQIAWIDDPSPLKIIQKSRQIGISHADDYHSVGLASQPHARLDVFISSRDEIQARLSLENCKYWADLLHLAAVDLGEVIFDRENNLSAYVLQFANGRRIYSLSSSPNALAGKCGHVKLDEFALHKEQRLLYRVAKPVTTWGGTLSVISTHRGAGTVFNEIIRDIKEKGNPMGWSHHRVTLQDAVEAGLVEKINAKKGLTGPDLNAEGAKVFTASASVPNFGATAPKQSEGGENAENTKKPILSATSPLRRAELASTEPGMRSAASARTSACSALNPESRAEFLARIRRECIDNDQWLQEYCCQPADESGAFLSYDLIVACEAECLKDFNYLRDCKNPLYLGMDTGRKKDLTVIDVGEEIGDVIWDRLRVELHNKTFAEQEFELFRLLALPNLRRACIDATGLGMQLTERARQRFGWKVEPVTFTAPIKEEMAYRLRSAFEGKALRIAADTELRADLRGIRKEITSCGNLRFDGESEDSHCDRFWAKALRQQALSRRSGVGAQVG